MIALLAQEIREIEGFGIAAFTDQTNVHPLGLAMLILGVLATLAVPRRHALIPFVLLMTLVPSAQRIAIATLDFPFLRILVVAMLLRVMARKEFAGFVWKPLDRIMVLWASAAFLILNVRTGGVALVYQSGVSLDALGGYFVARFLVRDWDDLRNLVRAVSFVAIPVALAFLFESRTQHNVFSVFGGVPEITRIREGIPRCQGPFNHPILAGCYWAAILPLIAARWWQPGSAKLATVFSSAAALVIVVCCASSTPVFSVMGAALGSALFFLRYRMHFVRWLLLLTVIGLHFVMKAPVWHLISRVSAVGGSTSYFRYKLIDSFIERFSEWAFLGVDSTTHWFYGGQDLTNQYVAQGVTAGFATFALFISIIAFAFGGLGRAWRLVAHHRPTLIFAWALGVSLFVHAVNFFGVSYFGTITGLWYLTLGVIGSLTPAIERMCAAGRARDEIASRIPVLQPDAQLVQTALRNSSGRWTS